MTSDPTAPQPNDRPTTVRKRTPGKAKWEQSARRRLHRCLRTYGARLDELVTSRANEFTTLQLVHDFTKAGLGYDESDISTQFRLPSGEIADCVLHLKGKPVILIEVKRAGMRINARHRAQLETYAANVGIKWGVLTNGKHWEVHRVTVPDGISSSSELTVRATFEPASAERFFYLTAESVSREQITDLWRRERALSKASLTRAITSRPVLLALRRQLHNARGGVLLDAKEIAQRLEEMFLDSRH